MRIFFWTSLLLLSACTTQRNIADRPIEQRSQDYLTAATLYAQRAGEYDALCIQAYLWAEERLKQHLAEGGKKPGIILDLDETVLDNSAYTAWQIISDRPYDDATWNEWVEDAEATAVPGAIHFLNFADSLGAELIYISNRDESGLEATIKNMDALGIRQTEPERFMFKTTTSDKTERRKKVADRGINVVMLIGDNLGDFDRVWDKPAPTDERIDRVMNRSAQFGTVFIALPNPLYGTWLQAIYNYDHSLTFTQQDSVRRANLRPWDGPR